MPSQVLRVNKPPVVEGIDGQEETEGTSNKTTNGNKGARGVDLGDRNEPAPNNPVDDAHAVHHNVRWHASAGAVTHSLYTKGDDSVVASNDSGLPHRIGDSSNGSANPH